jgi:hypothetical protein
MKTSTIVLIATALAVTFYGGKMALMMTVRGLRNNNPLNLRTGNNWDGESTTKTDPAFEVFSSPEWGIRAGGKTLLNYQRLHGLGSVIEIISRFAPATENDTAAYISQVSKALNIAPDQRIIVAEVLPQLVAAIIKHENGLNPYSETLIQNGLALIDGYDPKKGVYNV